MKISIVSSIICLVIAVDLTFAVPTAHRQKVRYVYLHVLFMHTFVHVVVLSLENQIILTTLPDDFQK